MKNFLKQTWVTVVAFVMLIISIILLAINGYTEIEISPIISQIFAVIDLISLLILAIKQLLQKKDTTNK